LRERGERREGRGKRGEERGERREERGERRAFGLDLAVQIEELRVAEVHVPSGGFHRQLNLIDLPQTKASDEREDTHTHSQRGRKREREREGAGASRT
jgi:hypothetical protein